MVFIRIVTNIRVDVGRLIGFTVESTFPIISFVYLRINLYYHASRAYNLNDRQSIKFTIDKSETVSSKSRDGGEDISDGLPAGPLISSTPLDDVREMKGSLYIILMSQVGMRLNMRNKIYEFGA